MATSSETILIRDGRVYDHDGNTDLPAVADILVEGAVISRIAPDLAAELERAATPHRVIDARDKLILPGFVNAHYHSHDILLRGCFENLSTEIWFMYALPPSYPRRSKEEIRARSLLAAVECVRNGITTVQDMLTVVPFDSDDVDIVLDAYDEIGLRTIFALQVADLRALDRVPFWRESVPSAYHGVLAGAADRAEQRDPYEVVAEEYFRLRGSKLRLTLALAPTNPEMCSVAFLEKLAALSAEHALPVYTHLYQSKAAAVAGRLYMPEHGGSQVDFLRALGLLGPRVSLAHCIWIRPEEVATLGDTGTNVILNLASNLKMKGGVPPIRAFLECGVPLALGTDNSGGSDAQNMFQQMKLCALLSAVSDPEPGPPTAADALRYATVGGARTAALESDIGALREGMKADLVIVDLSTPSFVPLNSAARQLVFIESGASIESVMIDGRMVMQDRKLLTIDEAALRQAVDAVMPELRRDAAQVRERNAGVRPYLFEAYRRSWSHDVGLDRYIATGGR